MYSCIVEHQMSSNEITGCGRIQQTAFVMPEELKLFKLTQSEQRKKDEKQQQRKRKQAESVEPEVAPVISPPAVRRTLRSSGKK